MCVCVCVRNVCMGCISRVSLTPANNTQNKTKKKKKKSFPA